MILIILCINFFLIFNTHASSKASTPPLMQAPSPKDPYESLDIYQTSDLSKALGQSVCGKYRTEQINGQPTHVYQITFAMSGETVSIRQPACLEHEIQDLVHKIKSQHHAALHKVNKLTFQTASGWIKKGLIRQQALQKTTQEITKLQHEIQDLNDHLKRLDEYKKRHPLKNLESRISQGMYGISYRTNLIDYQLRQKQACLTAHTREAFSRAIQIMYSSQLLKHSELQKCGVRRKSTYLRTTQVQEVLSKLQKNISTREHQLANQKKQHKDLLRSHKKANQASFTDMKNSYLKVK